VTKPIVRNFTGSQDWLMVTLPLLSFIQHWTGPLLRGDWEPAVNWKWRERLDC
jgi:hypothetical protein